MAAVNRRNQTPTVIVFTNLTAIKANTNHVMMPEKEKNAAKPEYTDVKKFFDRFRIVNATFHRAARLKMKLIRRKHSSMIFPKNNFLNLRHEELYLAICCSQISDLGPKLNVI